VLEQVNYAAMITRIILILLTGYVLVAVAVYLFQSRLLFLPEVGGRQLTSDPGQIGLEFDDVEIRTQDRQTLHGWWVPHPQARGSLLFSHGNAGNIAARLDSLRIFHALGINVLIYDYRGYGQSSGQPSEQGLYRDVEAAWKWLTETRGQAPERIAVFGRSLGAAVSAHVATRQRVGCLILESAFTSVPDRAAEIYWWLPVRWLARIRFDTRSHLQSVESPVLIVHSREDEVIPFDHGRKLAETAGQNAGFLEIEGDHNTGFLRSEPAYSEGLDRFFDSCLGPRRADRQ